MYRYILYACVYIIDIPAYLCMCVYIYIYLHGRTRCPVVVLSFGQQMPGVVAFKYMYACIYTYIYIHIYVYIYIYIYIYICLHGSKNAPLFFFRPVNGCSLSSVNVVLYTKTHLIPRILNQNLALQKHLVC